MPYKSALRFAAIPLSFMLGCSGTDSSPISGSGGANNVGGALGAGGAATGGMVSFGGTTSTGGAANAGGLAATGGAVATGGMLATGGSTAAAGGTSAVGGTTATGGINATTGGARTTGGMSSVGGANTGGSISTGGARTTGGVSSIGGASTGGSGTSGGGSGGASQGCGVSTWTPACSTSGTPCSIDVGGTARTYYVILPSNYSAAQQYPLVFQFHPRGGSAEQANMPNIRSSFTAIYVAPQGLSSSGSTGWPNTNGQDIAFTKAMINYVETNYCVDKARIFSTGFSYGGMMSFAIGCEMGDVFRAIAPMSGARYSGCGNGTHGVAMWGAHGLTDTVVPIADGRSARDAILSRNNCGTQTTATTPSPCVSYEGCDAGYPTTWCEFDGGHTPPSFAASAIVAFFKQF